MHLTKHHGLGNDFLVVLDELQHRPLTPTASLAQRLCDRHTGVGADGLVHGIAVDGAGVDGASGDGADVGFRLWNADGSEAEVSGNGLRCLVQAVARARGITGADLCVRVGTEQRRARIQATADPLTSQVAVEMGPIGAGPEIPEVVDGHLGMRAATASVGNPHLVVLVDDPQQVDLAAEGPLLEAAFPGGVNVEFVAAIDTGTLVLTVWERGAGITRACGSGACAAAHVARHWGLVGDRVEVRMPGGTATVTLHPAGTRLSGPATFVAAVEVPDE